MLLLSGVVHAQPAGTDRAVTWSVHDRFKLFSEAEEEDKAPVYSLMARMAASSQSLATHHDEIVRTLSGTGAAPLRRSNYRAPDRPGTGSGHYRAGYLYGGVHRVLVRLDGPDAAARHCRWRAGDHRAEGPCGRDSILPVGPAGPFARGEWGVDIELHVSIDGGPERSRGHIRFRDTLIVALGDSFISGEGNPDVPSVILPNPDPVFQRADWGRRLRPRHYERAQWWDEPCHRSLLSWPVLSSLAYSARRAQEAVSLVHLGCSGAVVADVMEQGERDLPGGGDEPHGRSQLAQLAGLLNAAPAGARRSPDRILLSIGGNDSGFVGVITTLLLPPSGYSLPILGPVLVGGVGEAICPYRDTGLPLSRLCRSRRSSEARLADLPAQYHKLAADLHARRWSGVYHFAYPNPILGEGALPCDLVASRNPGSIHEGGGFESLMGILHRPIHGRHYSWDFQLQYYPEMSLADGHEIVPGSGCDDAAEPSDSEVCQGLWVHSRLNRAIRAGAPAGWTTVDGHVSKTAGQGLCRRDTRFPLGLPRVVGGQWQSDWTTRSVQPYDRRNPRWFRTTNDSIVTQYGGPTRFHHGTVHPTLSAHIAYADAALETALP